MGKVLLDIKKEDNKHPLTEWLRSSNENKFDLGYFLDFNVEHNVWWLSYS